MNGALRDADARANVDGLPVEVDRLFEHRLDHASDGQGTHRIAAGQQDRELVATQPSHGVGFAQRFAQALATDLQHLVARVMAERIVDELEAVQVHQQHRDGRRRAGRARPLASRRRLNIARLGSPVTVSS